MYSTKECEPDSERLVEGPRRAGCGLEQRVQTGEWQGIRLVNSRPRRFKAEIWYDKDYKENGNQRQANQLEPYIIEETRKDEHRN